MRSLVRLHLTSVSQRTFYSPRSSADVGEGIAILRDSLRYSQSPLSMSNAPMSRLVCVACCNFCFFLHFECGVAYILCNAAFFDLHLIEGVYSVRTILSLISLNALAILFSRQPDLFHDLITIVEVVTCLKTKLNWACL